MFSSCVLKLQAIVNLLQASQREIKIGSRNGKGAILLDGSAFVTSSSPFNLQIWWLEIEMARKSK
ncbi:hypothetical protein B1209_22870 [Raoultella planticola]|jgi:hypothetical protein|nr:hypothetical protein CRT62_22545 [Raoultella planticola]ATM15577.1 hypothetical protein CRN15_12305 [Raoultella planticola]AUV55145.1 hypothetical protein B1209_22870 [Raoultella planticola]KAJ94789.1 hypothetical protein DF41_09020 [Raoultella planticola]PHH24481.1 hypothetical protein CRX55_10645 [Raoultella planticola]